MRYIPCLGGVAPGNRGSHRDLEKRSAALRYRYRRRVMLELQLRSIPRASSNSPMMRERPLFLVGSGP